MLQTESLFKEVVQSYCEVVNLKGEAGVGLNG